MHSLPAAPMWLIALYVPAMGAVNRYWIPPNWICLFLTVMEIFSIFVPCYMVAFRSRALHSETLAAIKVWETSKIGGSLHSSTSGSGSETTQINHGHVPSNGSMTESGTNLTGAQGTTSQQWKLIFGFSLLRSAPTPDLPNSGSNGAVIFPPNPAVPSGTIKKLPAALFSRDALEHCLRLNPEPLQQFAALKDFSGENIAFLTSVRQWKASFTNRGHSRKQSSSTLAAAGSPPPDSSPAQSKPTTKQKPSPTQWLPTAPHSHAPSTAPPKAPPPPPHPTTVPLQASTTTTPPPTHPITPPTTPTSTPASAATSSTSHCASTPPPSRTTTPPSP